MGCPNTSNLNTRACQLPSTANVCYRSKHTTAPAAAAAAVSAAAHLVRHIVSSNTAGNARTPLRTSWHDELDFGVTLHTHTLRTWRVKQYHLVVCVAGNAYHPVASGLRLEGDDGQLLTHDGVDQRALA